MEAKVEDNSQVTKYHTGSSEKHIHFLIQEKHTFELHCDILKKRTDISTYFLTKILRQSSISFFKYANVFLLSITIRYVYFRSIEVLFVFLISKSKLQRIYKVDLREVSG